MKVIFIDIKRMLAVLCISCMAFGIAGLASVSVDSSQAVKYVPTTQKVVALSFDDGPYPVATPELLKVLRAKGVKATFFVLGKNAEKNPQILAQVVADGHEIGSHSYNHRFPTRMSKEEFIADLQKAEDVISSVAPRPVLFRPPGGAYSDSLVAAVQSKGYTLVLWSIDPRDWAQPPVGQVVNNVMQNVKPGRIILMHDGQWPLPTPEAVGIIIDRLHEQGYQIVTVGQLLQYAGQN